MPRRGTPTTMRNTSLVFVPCICETFSSRVICETICRARSFGFSGLRRDGAWVLCVQDDGGEEGGDAREGKRGAGGGWWEHWGC